MKRKKMMLLSMAVIGVVVFTGLVFVKTGIVESKNTPFGTNEDVAFQRKVDRFGDKIELENNI